MPRFYFIIIFFLITGFMGFFLVWPAYQETSSMQSEIEEIKISIQEGEEYLAGLKSLSKKLEEYQDQLSMLDSILPEKNYLPQLYNFFPAECSRQGLLYRGMSHTFDSSENSKIKEILISLGVSGSYSSFRSLLSYIQNSARFFSIEDINLSSSKKGKFFSASLNIKTYSY